MLDISLVLLLVTAVVFFVLLFLLNSWLYQPLLKFMEERDESIRKSLENAHNNESGAKELLQKAKEIVSEAKHKASSMKQQALEEVKSETAKEIEIKKSELEKKYQEFLKELAEEERSVKSALISQLPLFKEALKAKFNKL